MATNPEQDTNKLGIPKEVLGDGKSWLRVMTDPGFNWAAEKFHHSPLTSWITPDDMTNLCTGVEMFLTFVQEESHIKGYSPTLKELATLGLLKTLFYLGDKFDGSLAGVYQREEPGKHNQAEGQKLDAKRDRQREAVSGLLRARTAYLRDDPWGELFAYTFVGTAAEPSKARALIETTGLKPKEWGGPLMALGTSGFRIAWTEIAGLGQIGKVNVQPWADLGSTVANLYTAHKRMELHEICLAAPLATDKAEIAKRKKISEDAHARLTELKATQIRNIQACAAMYVGLRVGSFLKS